MVTKETRRVSSSGRAQQLWDAIKAVRLQKQIPAITRMGRYMNRFYQLKKDETQRLLDLAVEDNLIKLENKIGTKGTKSGVEEKAYRLPTSDMLPRERHDWYCFHCHAAGEVVLCSTCHRVYHEGCLKEGIPELEEFVCKYCQAFQKISENYNKRDRRDLNHLFRLIVQKARRKFPEHLYAREIPQPPSKNIMEMGDRSATLQNKQLIEQQQSESNVKKVEEELWRASFLLKEQIDFSEIDRKCLAGEYRDTQEFKADCQLLVHNTVIFHGVNSNTADLARQMFRDCVCDIRDIDLCRDCFRYSIEKDDKYWFCKPCRPFHELVYARQKGFPYWPAKVIRIVDNMYDVRFFGGYHQRALVEKPHIRPISVNIHTLQVKRTSSWNKACEELRKHQEYLNKVKPDPDFAKEPFGNPFASPDLKVEFPESEHDESDDEEDCRYPGEIDQRQREEDAELLKKPNYVPGEAPPPPPPAPSIAPSAQVQTLHQPIVAATAAGTPVSIQTLQPQQYHIVHHHIPQQPQMRLVPVAGGAAMVNLTHEAQQHHLTTLNSDPNLGGGPAPEDVTKKKRGRPKKSKKEDSEDLVSSSSQQESRFINAGVQTPSKLLKPYHGSSPVVAAATVSSSNVVVEMPPPTLSSASAAANASTRKPTEREFKEFAEKLRADFEQEKKRAVNVATRSLERDLERLKADHNTEMEELIEKHKQEISENKKKQWCYHCEAEAIYWCCWNTAYCSIECQQEHWHKEHKRMCRRKR